MRKTRAREWRDQSPGNTLDQLCERQRRKPMTHKDRRASRQPEATHTEWVRPGSDWDKIRRSQKQRAEAKAQKTKRKQREREQAAWFQKEQDRQWDAACARHRERQQQSFDRMLDDAAEELAIEDARKEIRRDRR